MRRGGEQTTGAWATRKIGRLVRAGQDCSLTEAHLDRPSVSIDTQQPAGRDFWCQPPRQHGLA